MSTVLKNFVVFFYAIVIIAYGSWMPYPEENKPLEGNRKAALGLNHISYMHG